MAELAAAGDRRRISQAHAPDVADSRLGQRIVGRLLWLAGPLFIKRDWDPSDMITTIVAEDAFDIAERLGEISAPTLVIGGGRDRFYPPELHLLRPTLREGRHCFSHGVSSPTCRSAGSASAERV